MEPMPGSPNLYWIRNRSWNMCLNLQGAQAFDGGLPNVWNCESHLDQGWQIGNYYIDNVPGVGERVNAQIFNPYHGMCLQLQNVGAFNGGNPSVNACTDHPDQYWQIETVTNWAQYH